jgi:hypothetical protein
LQLKRVYESDINDAMLSASLQSDRLLVLERGRIIISSLERKDDGTQWIHWQRCMGLKHVSSSYGNENDTVPASGMGPDGRKVSAPVGTSGGVMFVEIQYDYLPVAMAWLLPARTIHYTAAYTVRDQRDFTAIFDTTPPTPRASCSTYSAT